MTRKRTILKSIRISKVRFSDFGTLEPWKIDVIPEVLGALGRVTNFEKYLDKIGIKIDLHTVQKTTLLETARILRKLLEC